MKRWHEIRDGLSNPRPPDTRPPDTFFHWCESRQEKAGQMITRVNGAGQGVVICETENRTISSIHRTLRNNRYPKRHNCREYECFQ